MPCPYGIAAQTIGAQKTPAILTAYLTAKKISP
jgi:hypothetical protein